LLTQRENPLTGMKKKTSRAKNSSKQTSGKATAIAKKGLHQSGKNLERFRHSGLTGSHTLAKTQLETEQTPQKKEHPHQEGGDLSGMQGVKELGKEV